jgi:hypothetical protein
MCRAAHMNSRGKPAHRHKGDIKVARAPPKHQNTTSELRPVTSLKTNTPYCSWGSSPGSRVARGQRLGETKPHGFTRSSMCVWAHKDSRGNPARSHKSDIKIVSGPLRFAGLAQMPSRAERQVTPRRPARWQPGSQLPQRWRWAAPLARRFVAGG